MVVEAAYPNLCQLRQGSMSVQKYSAEFRTLVAKVRDWSENMEVDYFRNGLNADLVAKALDHDGRSTLVGWIQVASEAESSSGS